MMRTQKRKHGFSKFTLGAITLVVSLALLLGSAQTTLAKNTPIPPPDQLGTGAVGTGEGGGGSVGPFDEALTTSATRTKASASSHLMVKDGGGSLGTLLFEKDVFGYYYGIVFELFKLNLIIDSQHTQPQMGKTNYE